MLLIHIGAPKTASTLLHRIIHDNRARFAAAGLRVPERGWTAGSGHMSVRQSLMRNGDGDPEVEALRAYYRDILAHDEARTILTTETFWPVSPDQILQVYPQAASARIMMILRAQSDLIVSHYLQKVKSGVEERTLRGFAEAEHEKYDFATKAAEWGAAFGTDSLHILIYEDLVGRNGVIPGVLEEISRIFDVDTTSILAPEETDALQTRRVNVRLPMAAYPYYFAVSRADCAADEKVLLRQLINEHVAAQPDIDTRAMAGLIEEGGVSADGRAAFLTALDRHYGPVRDLLDRNQADLTETLDYIESKYRDGNTDLFAAHALGSPEVRRLWGLEP
ncbi:MAG: hypothetical protein AAF408_02400 [Pseudomonadota bacterium]